MPETTTDSPPRRRRPAATPPETPSGQSSTQREASPVSPPGKAVKGIEERLNEYFAFGALGFMAAGDETCAAVMAKQGPVVSHAWASLATQSPAVKRAIESLLRGGAWGGAIFSTMALVIPIAAHHGAPVPDFVTPMFLGKQPDKNTGGENGNTPPDQTTVPGDATNPGGYAGN